MSVKLEGFVKPYSGKHMDWDVFWSKYLVLADVSGWTTDDDVMKRLPLFLDGDAFLVYSKLSDTDKKDKKKVKTTMEKSLGVDKSAAYSQFMSRRLKADESIDAWVADLRRLLTQAGHKDAGDKDSVIIEQMLAGLQSDIARQVCLAFAGKEITASGCADAVRALVAVNGQGRSVSAATGVRCHHCNEYGHIRKDCPQRASKPAGDASAAVGGGHSHPVGGDVVCYFCDRKGHINKNCEQRKKWLASQPKKDVAGASVQAVSHCLMASANSSRSGLPHVFVDYAAPASDEWQRAISVIDTGSSRTLVSESLLDHLDVDVEQGSENNIVALDGNQLSTRGTVKLKFRRNDGPVSIPEIIIEAVVLPDLCVVAANILIGIDFVSQCGGLHLEYAGESLRSCCDG